MAAAVAGCEADAPPSEPQGDAPEAAVDGPGILSTDGKADGFGDVAAVGPLPESADLEAPLAALFAPDDPVTTLELTLIREVVQRRGADDAGYAEGDNPFRIRYAVYNLRNPAIVEALADAADAGVDVQVLIEDGQLDPARTWNFADERLVERGFELVASHRDLDDAGRRSADLVGIEGSGLMHLKARLFDAPDFRAGLTGSMNPGDNAVLNEETLHLVRDPALLDRYAAAYEANLKGQRIDNRSDDDAAVNVLFTPGGAGPRAGAKMLEWLADEDEQILLMVFSLRDVQHGGRSLVDTLAQKARAGVPVHVITDRKQSDGVDADGNQMFRDDPTEDRLRAAGVHVWEATNRATPFTAMHHKVAVLGRTDIRVITDAANWTFAALGSGSRRSRNHESMLFIDSARLDDGVTGRRYIAQWLRVLERYAHQSEREDGEPGFEAVFATLTADPGWPAQPVRFVADEAFTEWGESIRVRGDHERLGAWSRDVALDTDGDTYPTWTGEVSLPVGTRFEFKFVAGFDRGDVRWEGGDNRKGRAAPQALTRDPAVEVGGAWR